jgi:hypothetical protein
MDKVLTRKMFRDRYFEIHKPKQLNKGGILNVQHFQEGGLTSREKAIIASTFAAPLLKSTQRQGEGLLSGVLRSVGEGTEKLTPTLIALEEAQKKDPVESVRSATAAEKESLGFNKADRLVVKVKDGVVTGIADKPTFGEREKAADRSATLKQADKILLGVREIGSGPIAGRIAKATAALNMNPKAAAFNVTIEEFKKSAIKALRGAQVGPLEEASFNALLPTITDNEDVIIAKVNTMKEKLQEIDSRLDASGAVTDPDNLEYYKDAFSNFNINANPESLTYDPQLDFYVFKEGKLIKK